MSVFEVAIGYAREQGKFRVQVVDSPVGHAAADVELGVAALLARRPNFENTLLLSSVVARRNPSNEEKVILATGKALFAALLGAGEVGGRYRAAAAVADERGEKLRIVLRIDAPELAALPWEAMYDEGASDYVCLRHELVRYVPVAAAAPPLAVQKPLRILGIISSPTDLDLLNARRERDQLAIALREPIKSGLVEVTWAASATWGGIHDLLMAGPWHVVHFIGHGDFDPDGDEGRLALTAEDGTASLVEASRFAELLRQATPIPRLVVLNSCQGGAASTSDPFAGTAASLARGVAAVAAMQYSVSDTAAIAFAGGFYSALAHSRGIDEAVSSGRVRIRGTSRQTLEWLTPVLYLRGHENRLFAVTPAQPVPQVPQPTPTAPQSAAATPSAAPAPAAGTRPASIFPRTQAAITVPSPNVHFASAAAGSHEAARTPVSSSASWRERVGTSRKPTVGPYTGPNETGGCLAMPVLVLWAVSAVWLAWAKDPHAWLAAAAAAGLVSLVGIGLPDNARIQRRFMCWPFAVPCVVIYVVSALAVKEAGVIRAWTWGSLILYLLAVLFTGIWRDDANGNPELMMAGERERRVIKAIESNRWLTDTGRDRTVESLLAPLAVMPGARFACLTEEYFEFLAVVGNRVTLGKFADWPPGDYTLLHGIPHEIYRNGQIFPAAAAELTRADAATKEWRAFLGRTNGVQVVVVVRPNTPSKEGAVILHFSEDDGITVTTQDAFADFVGSFLAPSPLVPYSFSPRYDLNPKLLEQLHSRLATDGQDLAASSPHEQVPPSDAPTAGGAAPADT